ncbi:MAG: 30S ribosomal protein S20 [Pseudomonadota bacterium]|nr:30S ribosomal protein S20 [Pseudomonadota bacterium]
MANLKSSKKRARQTVVKTAVNRARVSKIRTSVKKVEHAIQEGNKAAAQEAFRSAQPMLQGGVTKGVLHKNTVARKLSRLSAAIKAMAA